MSNICELCGSEENLGDFLVDGANNKANLILCSTCRDQIENDSLDENYFNCLNDSMWSENSGVKVLTYRLLNSLGRQDLLDMMYLEDSEREWAEAGISNEEKLVYKDSNGVTLQVGDTVVITKDLDVKGTGFTAKRGTAVRNIGLVANDSQHIEGRVNGVKIHILTKFLKKS
ncbi:MAG: PhnA domain-containing protein [Sulfurimonas sp.]|nr:PhnA domain-containing protein [Sulfurimonas sp.]